ncbi:RNA polymerase III subunit RPC82 helix-turn-helix domain-containing protein [Ephemerocybe angulata]|uniref:DNA-directed RNA polymerase III subunit RPC3 n=1 Tax=Ephemerocybe angulata TaxID=980116 RepID=A0A8H6IIV6_9AGAR|nr:RNA polymerase III subunit RPC82 helix-turn-helix domain-containing protein [Tulosesus angulatus]
MADSHTGCLCTEIVHTHFGPLTSKVASALLTRGRLPLSQLVVFTGLKLRTIRASLISLIQHNVVWHVQNAGEPEMFEVNVDECLMRLRYGRYILQAEKLFGKPAAEIVQVILQHGKLVPPEMFSLLRITDPKTLLVYKQALHKLVAGSYLRASTPKSHVSPKDRLIQYEIDEKKKIVGFPTAKQLREAKEVAEARIKQEDDETEKVGLKRKAKEQPGHRNSKKKAVEDETVVDDEVYFRINCERFNVHIRNTLMTTAAKERFNVQAAVVLEAAIRATEKAQLNLSDARTDPISVSNVMMQLSDVGELLSGLAYPSKKVSAGTCVKDYLGMLSSADNPTPAGKAAAFISFGSSKVQVEFETISRRLRRQVLEAVTREKHGSEGVRILRLLLGTGKMDEKQISKVVLMAAKDVRPLLAAMAADSIISTQEVPKSADRNPTRTFYLWYVDLYKAYAAILEDTFKTLYNISARRRAEREAPEVKAVLEKSQRTDVQQDESLLTRIERETLRDWEAKEQKLTVLESRVEELVFILRDLAVHGIEDLD